MCQDRSYFQTLSDKLRINVMDSKIMGALYCIATENTIKKSHTFPIIHKKFTDIANKHPRKEVKIHLFNLNCLIILHLNLKVIMIIYLFICLLIYLFSL